jgi:hypothetical protein
MSTTEQDWIGKQRRFHKQSAGPFRAVEFVRTNRNQVSIELMDVFEWFFAEPLNRIAVKDNTIFSADRA